VLLVSFLIMLREGIEAALIVGIIAAFLKQSGYSSLLPKVWLGVTLAALLCFGVGFVLHRQIGEIPQKEQEFVVGAIGLVAVAILTYMILWMKKAARSIKQELHQSVQAALNRGKGHGWALVGMAFLAVAREGMECVFFMLAILSHQASSAQEAATIDAAKWGGILGLLCAVVIGALIYQGGMRLNLAKFFRWTGIFLILVAAGLLSGAFRAFHEAGVWNLMQVNPFDWSSYQPLDWSQNLHEDSPLGVLLGGFFGYTDHPVLSDFVFYFGYLIPVMYLFLRNPKPTPSNPKP